MAGAPTAMDYVTLGRTGLRVSVIGLGGGGHSRAAAAMVVGGNTAGVVAQVREVLPRAVRPTLRVSSLMSLGVQTVSPTTPIGEVAELMQRHGHEGYPVVDGRKGHIVGLVTRRAVVQMRPPSIAEASSRSPGMRSSAFASSTKT